MNDINNMTYEELLNYTKQLQEEIRILKENERMQFITIDKVNDKLFFYEDQLMYFKDLFRLIVVGGKNNE